MGLLSFFKSGNYFDKGMTPKCDYCQNGKRARDGNKVLCEKRGLVDCSYSCSKFIYSPLKRIPVKQLRSGSKELILAASSDGILLTDADSEEAFPHTFSRST